MLESYKWMDGLGWDGMGLEISVGTDSKSTALRCNNNIRACEHLILGQFRMGARSAIYAPLTTTIST